MFDLCECSKCKECNGIDVDKINFNLYKCKHNKHILNRYNINSLVYVGDIETYRGMRRVNNMK